MKKFFKDVIGEIKNPSEDANKVLDVIRRVIRVALFMSILFYIINLGWSASNIVRMYRDGYIENYKQYFDESLFNLFYPYVKSLIKLIIYTVLFFICNKSVKTNKLVGSKVFYVVLITLFALQLTSFRLDVSRIFGFLMQIIITASLYGILYFAFWDIKNNDSDSMELSIKRMYSIAVIGYILLIIHLVQQTLHLSTSSFYYLSYFIEALKYTGVTIWEWFAVIGIILNVIVFISLILLLLFSLIGRKKELSHIRNKSYLLIVMLFVSIVATIVSYFILDGGYLYFIVFAIAVSYQNKYKIYYNKGIGKRIYKNTLEKIKTGFNNYLSFKE